MAYPCVVCNLEVHRDDEAFECEVCTSWHHRTCGNGITSSVYWKVAREEVPFNWTCLNCIPIEHTTLVTLETTSEPGCASTPADIPIRQLRILAEVQPPLMTE